MPDELTLFDLPEAPRPRRSSTLGAVVVAATDGACQPNPGTAAGAWYVSPTCYGVVALDGPSTNNIGELVAIQALVTAVPQERALEIVYDSEYAKNSVTKWSDQWSKGGTIPPAAWRTRAREPVRNAELIAHIRALLAERSVKWTKARAHTSVDNGGHRLNQEADRLASEAVRVMRRGGIPDPGPGWAP